jgi:transcriptional regulator with XRE-family HTH domain
VKRRPKISSAYCLAVNLRRILAERGFTGPQFAEMCGVRREQVWKILELKHSSTLTSLDVVAKALGVSPSDLIRVPETPRGSRKSKVLETTSH